jgi:hypothetical protein
MSKGSRPSANRAAPPAAAPVRSRPSALVDARIIYCLPLTLRSTVQGGDCLDELRRLADGCVDLVYIDPAFNSNRNYEVFSFGGETKEKRAFEDRHASTEAYIDYMRPYQCATSSRNARV